jgi:hypothetical protein
MKKILLVIIGITIASAAFCQEEGDEYRTIFGNKNISVSGFGAFDMQFSYMGGGFAFGAGGSGGVLLGGQVFFGGFGLGCNIDKTVEMNNLTIDHVGIGYGGLMFGYIINHKNAIHPAVFLQTGWGGVNSYDNHNSMYDNYPYDNVFVLNPSVEMEMNITRFFRMAVGANYQITTGVNEYTTLNNSDFSGPGGKISFRFGWFN